MNNYKIWLKIENLIPIAFYAYTSGVNAKILSQNHNYKTDEHDFLEKLGEQLIDKLVDKVQWDNKVVVECKIVINRDDQKAVSNIFIGRYDNIWSVGFGVWGDEWIEPIIL
ncbi:MAG: hypothetical protein H5T96_09510 [Tissierellales bacterium]|nr:hypothetical protein [Tissierellales bacterium]